MAFRKTKGSFCSAFGCNNNKGRNPELSFFRFPRSKEQDRLVKWVAASKRKDLLDKIKECDYLYINCRLCSAHFEPIMFMDPARSKLIWNAVPFKDPPKCPRKPPTERNVNSQISHNAEEDLDRKRQSIKKDHGYQANKHHAVDDPAEYDVLCLTNKIVDLQQKLHTEQSALQTVDNIITAAKQLGMTEKCAEFFRGQLHNCQRRSQEIIEVETNPGWPGNEHDYALKRKRNSDDDEGDQSDSKKYTCPYCQLQVASRQSLFKHKQRKHPQEKAQEVPSAKIQCSQCQDKCFESLKDLLMHQNEEHQGTYEIHHSDFECEEDFNRWKVDIEAQCGMCFVKFHGDRKTQNHVTTCFYCNRSGRHETRGDGKQVIKSPGSSKIGGYCSSFIKKTFYLPSGKIHVEYSLDHSHWPTKSKDARTVITQKPASDMKSNDIRDVSQIDIQDSNVTDRDILNIKSNHNISEEIDTPILCNTKADLNLDELKSTALDNLAKIKQLIESAQDVQVVQSIIEFQNSALSLGKEQEVNVSNQNSVNDLSFPSKKTPGALFSKT